MEKHHTEDLVRKLVMNRRGVATAVLAIVSGGISVISGALIWVPQVVTGIGWGVVPPVLGFVGFLVGMAVLLGGVFMLGGIVSGEDLVLWSSLPNVFFSFVAAEGMGYLMVKSLGSEFLLSPIGVFLGWTISIFLPLGTCAVAFVSKWNQMRKQ